ncbi:uncharacterized protein [Mytilus edulis]|uniref:uncharacterized protein n=1 Tax=Mytilus edulis TaxID=6550 RepID=UPI0039F0C29A
MALSKPQLGIQSPLQCQLCERDSKISWKCLECDLLMCSSCKNNIHPKFKTAGEHRIIAIKDIDSTSSLSKDSANVDITVVEEYQSHLNAIVQLAISLDDSLWIGEGFHKKGVRLFSSHKALQKVKCEGNKLKVISSFNIQVYGIAITPDNDLLIATDGQFLKKIKSGTNKILDTVYDLKTYHPGTIYVTRNNKIIVGVVVTETKCMVLVMDQKGNHEKVYGEGQTGSISFRYTFKITSTNDGHIFVIDQLDNDGDGRVVVLRPEGTINTYSGHSAINTQDTEFSPTDLTTTPSDKVIVVDLASSTLHILNSSGNLITYISTTDKQRIVQNPCTIGLAMVGQFCMIYLGTTTKEDSKEKGKLYKLNLIGC